MVITDPALLKGRDPVAVCRAAAQGGATMLQVRWKDGVPAAVLELTRALVAALPIPVLVNDRVDIALAGGAAGAHLGWDDPPLDAVRPHVPPGFLLGLSVGSAEEAERARATSADYWSVGPCFTTPTKRDVCAVIHEHGNRKGGHQHAGQLQDFRRRAIFPSDLNQCCAALGGGTADGHRIAPLEQDGIGDHHQTQLIGKRHDQDPARSAGSDHRHREYE